MKHIDAPDFDDLLMDLIDDVVGVAMSYTDRRFFQAMLKYLFSAGNYTLGKGLLEGGIDEVSLKGGVATAVGLGLILIGILGGLSLSLPECTLISGGNPISPLGGWGDGLREVIDGVSSVKTTSSLLSFLRGGWGLGLN